ncbi:putative acyl-CoA dehydrogenase FadE [Actinoplanes philippinensis]|uniref:Acyl-CoA dehydrogenase n=1 Tax=Actinoplanes philippinensis TaxID=35752 RepID=A0A1I2A2K5_9ACTN|nr:acyl-CoA dehydrogenase family protein [Actinoplanes philippinensis]GIE75146.1 putative acyl-CoA dehydrogenase FadE [Actinoplanes philippinensis]SFE37798.1 Acyl-CoA dehydrogenase [Actinoplanes philippinensis]
MNLDLDPPAAAFRDLVREWLAGHVPRAPLPSPDTEAGSAAHRLWEAALAEAGLAAVSWPVEYGGRAAPPLHALLFDEEYFAAGAPARIVQNGLFLLAPTLLAHGTPAQCARILPPMARGEQVWAQAWSEPEAGSDLAAVRSRARPVDGGWLLSGQKTWSSRAVVADRAFGLFRSGPGARHRGLTYLMFDLRAPGVTVRPIRQLDGTAGFAEIFLDDVFVPGDDVIGAPGDGWRVAMSTAGHERGLTLRGPGRFTVAADRLVGLASHGDLGGRVADAWIGARAYRMQAYASLDEPVAPSATKLFWSQLDVALHETALDALGPLAEIDPGWTGGYLFSLAGPIYAGTNEIQRDILAQRELGLPR